MNDLYEAQGPRESVIECAPGAHHRIRWDAGVLSLEDHDLDSERALAAMGGERPMCVEIADAYRDFTGNPDMLTRACTAVDVRDDLLAMRDEARRHPFGAWVAAAGSPSASVSLAVRKAREAHTYFWNAMMIANLPESIKQGFVIDSVAAIQLAWEDGAVKRDFDYDELLRSQVANKLVESLQSWLPNFRHRPSSHVTARLAPTGHSDYVVTSWPGEVEVLLPLRWFADVWARGIPGAVEGCFVLEVVRVHSHDDVAVRAVRWRTVDGFAQPVIAGARVRRHTGEWSIAWDQA